MRGLPCSLARLLPGDVVVGAGVKVGHLRYLSCCCIAAGAAADEDGSCGYRHDEMITCLRTCKDAYGMPV